MSSEVKDEATEPKEEGEGDEDEDDDEDEDGKGDNSAAKTPVSLLQVPGFGGRLGDLPPQIHLESLSRHAPAPVSPNPPPAPPASEPVLPL